MVPVINLARCGQVGLLGLLAGLSIFVRVGAQPINTPEELIQQFDKFVEPFFVESDEDRQRLAEIEITVEEERQIGRQLFTAFRADLDRQKVRLSDQGRDAHYVRALVTMLQPLLEHADRYGELQVYVADTPMTDARAFPAGTIVVSRGMIDFAQTEAALVGVLAHELAHIDRGHQLDMMRRLKRAQQSFAGGGADPARAMEAGLGLAKQFARPFRPEQESQADSDAVAWTFRAGYDPQRLAELFERLHRRDPSSQQVTLPSFLKSHPYHRERSREVRDQTQQLRRANPDQPQYVGRRNLATRTPRSERRFSE